MKQVAKMVVVVVCFYAALWGGIGPAMPRSPAINSI